MPKDCPICESLLLSTVGSPHGGYQLECPRCGRYSLSEDTLEDLPGTLRKSQEKRAALSHAVRKMVSHTPGAKLAWELVEHVVADPSLPPLSDQLANFMEWAATAQPSYGKEVELTDATLGATGALDNDNLWLVLEYAHESGYIAKLPETYVGGASVGFVDGVRLTFRGWHFVEDVRRGKVASRVAFMAMKFGDSALDAVYQQCFKEAVADAGFSLKRLDEGQAAGLIDDRLRVEIRQARFLISDLTHQNNGAYWEAGYAEGLGKQVIYTCEAGAFRSNPPHFDTNHHLTVIWDHGNLDAARAKLRDTIRATFPDEAKLAD